MNFTNELLMTHNKDAITFKFPKATPNFIPYSFQRQFQTLKLNIKPFGILVQKLYASELLCF